jgi:RimJ/RimL family protein N-acetyltransferase
MTLQTPRLLLRELTQRDLDALHAIQRDPHVTRYMSYEPQTLDQTMAYIDAAILAAGETPRSTYDFAVTEIGSERLIGRCGFGVRRPEHREAMLWYELSPGSWGRGYATEAATALVDFAFRSLNMHRVWADCDPRNRASCQVAERLGMTLEGRLRENYWLKGEWCSTLVYGILENEWEAQTRE